MKFWTNRKKLKEAEEDIKTLKQVLVRLVGTYNKRFEEIAWMLEEVRLTTAEQIKDAGLDQDKRYRKFLTKVNEE